MHQIKGMPRAGWLIIGVVVGLLLVPSGVALAKATLKFTGIEGTSGHKADVTSAQQVQVADADPSNLYTPNPTLVTGAAGGSSSVVVATSASHALIINEITFDVTTDPSPGATSFVQVFTGSASCTFDGRYDNIINPTFLGLTSLSIPSGLAIPAGGALCALENGSVQAYVDATGYQVPPTSVPAATVHGTPDLPRLH
jgi:hypothetical protein